MKPMLGVQDLAAESASVFILLPNLIPPQAVLPPHSSAPPHPPTALGSSIASWQ